MRATVEAAARANAHWCDAVCRSHGLRPAFVGNAWTSPQRTPPLYPDAVTLPRGIASDELLERLDTETPECSVKDSFSDLELSAAKFTILSEAQWIFRAARPRAPARAGLHWTGVRDAVAFSTWEAAWVRAGGQQGVLLPGLAERSEIRILSAIVDGQVVAGVAANRSGSLAHVSNFFTELPNVADAWGACLDAVALEFPDAALVTYETGASLAIALDTGFTPMGPLRIWVAER